ncbi:MAG TPA: hypothetical protein VKT52_11705, partial [Ktedonobacterales bacterium]|nr:hypothetical protein [Ktedonobacterales bacterium]
MERSEIVYQVAANARARCRTMEGYPFKSARALVERLCDAMDVYVTPTPPSDVMLGGAYARLQLWSPEHPTQGGMVWV